MKFEVVESEKVEGREDKMEAVDWGYYYFLTRSILYVAVRRGMTASQSDWFILSERF